MKFLIAIACIAVVSGAPTATDVETLTVGSNKFGFNAYKEAIKTNPGNYLISPVSAHIAMAFANAGAEGETSEQIVQALHLPSNEDVLQRDMQALLELLQGNENYNLTTANKIYVKNNYKLKEDFKRIATTVFDSEVEGINFDDAEKAVNDINKWVEQQTEDKIKDLISSDDISQDTRLVLINALYLSANWLHKFSVLPAKEQFYTNGETHVDVDMMKATNMFRYYACNIHNLTVLELPFQGDEIVMTIILPNERDGLARVEGQFDEILGMQMDIQSEAVEVILPKFKIESTVDLKAILTQLGVTKAFSKDLAELTGIADEPEQLYINKVAQKTFVKVDENGIEAAAATAVIINMFKSAPVFFDATLFVADHPFMFVLTHKRSRVNLFVGKVTNPQLN